MWRKVMAFLRQQLTLAGLAENQAFTLGVFAGELAGAANSLCLLASLLFRRLFKVVTKFHFAEDAFTLQLLFQGPKGLIDVVVANQYLHALVPMMTAAPSAAS